MQEFQVGNLIMGKRSSVGTYSMTTMENNFVGKITEMYPSGEVIEVEIVYSDVAGDIGERCTVEAKHFEPLSSTGIANALHKRAVELKEIKRIQEKISVYEDYIKKQMIKIAIQ